MTHNLNIEVYEFLLKNYPYKYANKGVDYDSHPDISIKTGIVNSSDVNECGLVKNTFEKKLLDEIRVHPTFDDDLYDSQTILYPNHENIRICDPIKSNIYTTTEALKLNENKDDYKYSFKLNGITSKDLIAYSGIYGSKNTGINWEKYGKDLILEDTLEDGTKIIDTFFPSMKVLYDDNKFETIETVKKILSDDWYSETVNYDSNSSKSIPEKQDYFLNHTLIKKINPRIDDKFIIIGDIHGSYSTFIRILLRLRKMEILNEDCILQNNYNIIFLGDVVDRGQYGYEILMILFLLKILNPSNVHINRGNHEEQVMNVHFGFLNEVKSKFGKKHGEIVHAELNNVFIYQHSALLIKNPINNKYTYLAHGGLPTTYDDLTQNYILLKSFVNFDNPYNIIIRNDILTKGSKLLPIPNSIRWNDFIGAKNNLYNPVRSLKIGQEIINKIREPEINIELIIRGHQDSFYNTKLLYTVNYDVDNIQFESFKNINDYQAFGIANSNLALKVHCYKFTHLITVNPEHYLNINGNPIPELLPVITVSTNTDTGRNLSKDSFVILKYIEDFNQDLDGCAIVDSDEEKQIIKNRILNRVTLLNKELSLIKSMYPREYEDDEEYNKKLAEYQRLIKDPLVPELKPSTKGGYYDKYLKYKNKYLLLKKQFI
jgi:hypothetical protein